MIEDNTATGVSVPGLELPPGDYSFEIAVFDTDGLYSNFVALDATLGDNPPTAPTEFRFFNPVADPVVDCDSDPGCIVVQSTLIIR